MASCHARAVMLRRKEYQDEIDYNIALAIATHMGSDGRPATVSLATIAEYAHCHYNTADKRVKGMTAAGLLLTGRGGRYLTYSVPYDGDDGEAEGDRPTVSEIAEMRLEMSELKEQVTQLAAVVTKLSNDLHIIVTSPSHELHMNFTPIERDDVNKVGKQGSKEKILPPVAAGEGEAKKGQERKQALSALEKHFSAVSGLDLPKRETEKEKKAAAVSWWNPLGEMWEQAEKDTEITRQHITAVVSKMRRDGLNISSPQSILKVYRSEVSAAKSAITAAGNQFEKVLTAARTGSWNEVDEPSKQVARAMGGAGTFKTMRPDQETIFRKQFYERLNGHAQR